MLHQLGAASQIELQPHWLQQASVVLVKVQCQVLNRKHETNFANYSLITFKKSETVDLQPVGNVSMNVYANLQSFVVLRCDYKKALAIF